MQTFNENIIGRATKVLNDCKGDIHKALYHFETLSTPESCELYKCLDTSYDYKANIECANYLKSLL